MKKTELAEEAKWQIEAALDAHRDMTGHGPDVIYLGSHVFEAIGGFSGREDVAKLKEQLEADIRLHTGRSDAIVMGEMGYFEYPEKFSTGVDSDDPTIA